MTKRTERAERTKGKNGAGQELAHLVEPMLAGMSSTRQHLLAWVHAQGLAALDELFREEAVALAGPKGRQQAQRTHHHWGTTATELTFGGRRVQMPRPRVRRTSGGEATLPSVARFRERDPLTARMMQQLLAGVSTRQYDASLEARPSGRRTRGSSKSAVSRSVVRRTRQRLHEQLTRRLEGLEVVALFMDGVVVAQQTGIVVLGITRGGGTPAADGARDVAGEERSCRCRRECARGAGRDAHRAKAGAAADAAPLLRDDELHRESDRHAAPRHPEYHALARWRHAAAVDRTRPATRRRALPAHQAAWRAGRARDRARCRDGRRACRVRPHDHRRRKGEGHNRLRSDLLEGAAMPVSPSVP